MSFTPFNAPLLSGLLGDMEIAAFFSVAEDCKQMLRFEAALARAEARCGVIPEAAADAIEAACHTFEPDMRNLSAGAGRDGLAVPAFVSQLRAAVGEEFGRYVHKGATSQDVIDTSLVLRLQAMFPVLDQRLAALGDALETMMAKHGQKPLMARTRMQAALPITVADRIATWANPLADQRARLKAVAEDARRLQFGGAVGTLDALGEDGPAVRAVLGEALGLTVPPQVWHSDRRPITRIGQWFSDTTGITGKMGQDIVLMAQNGIDEVGLSGGGGSSAMAHKKNPVKAEALVSLARFNAVLSAGLGQSLIHEQERSGSAWMLEWMIIPQMAVITGASIRNALDIVTAIETIGSPD